MNIIGMKMMSLAVAGVVVVSAWAQNAVIAKEDLFSIGRSIIDTDKRTRMSLDRADALYKCGDEAVFTVTICDDKGVKASAGQVSWVLDNYGAQVFARGSVDVAKENPFVVKGTLNYPGFLRVTVNDAKGRKMRSYSAAYDPERIRTGVPKPADFDAFWDGLVARVEQEVPLDPQVEPLAEYSKGGVDVSRVSFATLGGKRVYGVLSRPKDKTKGPYPVRVYCPGAGPGYTLRGCRGDSAHVSLYMSVHGLPVPATDKERLAAYDAQEARYRAIHGPSRARAYPVAGLTQGREDSHYIPVILGVNRAVNWLATLPEVDPMHFAYSGTSQGGGFGLYLAGLNRHITRAYIGVPALADVLGCKANGRQSGWPRILEYESQTDAARLARIEANAPYIDGAYFATRIRIPVRLSVGYADDSCAPHAVCATYNAIPAKDKKLYHGIGGTHGSRNAPMQEVNEWLAQP